MTPHAALEITGGVLRLQHTPGFGAPFYAACTVVGDEGVATVKGLQADAFTRPAADAIMRELRTWGFHTVRWSRHRGGRTIWLTRRLT